MVTRRSTTAAPMATVSRRPSVHSHLSTRMIVSVVDMVVALAALDSAKEKAEQ